MTSEIPSRPEALGAHGSVALWVRGLLGRAQSKGRRRKVADRKVTEMPPAQWTPLYCQSVKHCADFLILSGVGPLRLGNK